MAPTVAVAPAPTARPATVGWGSGWRNRAAHFFCLLVLFGFPVFSVPCPKGVCSSPLEVVATYGYTKEVVPEEWITGMLYPATLMLSVETLMGEDPQSFQFPTWGSILPRWNLTSTIVKTSAQRSFSFIPNFLSIYDDQSSQSMNWAFVAACVLFLIGGAVSFAGPNKFSAVGVMLVIWYIFIEGGKREDVFVQPMFAVALVSSLGWINFRQLFSLPKVEETTPAADAQSEDKAKKKE